MIVTLWQSTLVGTLIFGLFTAVAKGLPKDNEFLTKHDRDDFLVSIEPIRSREGNLTVTYEDADARFDSLADYFRDSNQQLIDRIERVKNQFEDGQRVAGATYVAGSAGVGKSFVITQLDLPSEYTSEPIRLAKMFTEMAPDLQSLDGGQTFNELPYSHGLSVEAMLGKLDLTGKAFILIDDFDEVQETTAMAFLQQLETYVQESNGRFVHFIVFGRPEAFWPWLNHQERVASELITANPIDLHGPDFRTTGDLKLRSKLYFAYVNRNEPHKQYPEEWGDAFVEYVTRHPFLSATIEPLAAGNFVLDQVFAAEGNLDQLTVEEIERDLLCRFLERDHESHGRPMPNDEVYMRILEEAAVFPLIHDREMSAIGEFEVRDEDVINYRDADGQPRTVLLRNVLSRSGIVSLNQADNERSLFRFKPLWVQAHLVQRWNKRNVPNYVNQDRK